MQCIYVKPQARARVQTGEGRAQQSVNLVLTDIVYYVKDIEMTKLQPTNLMSAEVADGLGSGSEIIADVLPAFALIFPTLQPLMTKYLHLTGLLKLFSLYTIKYPSNLGFAQQCFVDWKMQPWQSYVWGPTADIRITPKNPEFRHSPSFIQMNGRGIFSILQSKFIVAFQVLSHFQVKEKYNGYLEKAKAKILNRTKIIDRAKTNMGLDFSQSIGKLQGTASLNIDSTNKIGMNSPDNLDITPWRLPTKNLSQQASQFSIKVATPKSLDPFSNHARVIPNKPLPGGFETDPTQIQTKDSFWPEEPFNRDRQTSSPAQLKMLGTLNPLKQDPAQTPRPELNPEERFLAKLRTMKSVIQYFNPKTSKLTKTVLKKLFLFSFGLDNFKFTIILLVSFAGSRSGRPYNFTEDYILRICDYLVMAVQFVFMFGFQIWLLYTVHRL